MSADREPRTTLGATPVDGIIYREMLDGLTLEEIADRYECEIANLRRRLRDKAAIWRRRPPPFLRPAPYPNTYGTDDFDVMIADAKAAGWLVTRRASKWLHFCADCKPDQMRGSLL